MLTHKRKLEIMKDMVVERMTCKKCLNEKNARIEPMQGLPRIEVNSHDFHKLLTEYMD